MTKRNPIKKKNYRPNCGTTPLQISRYLAWLMNKLMDQEISLELGKVLISAQKVRLSTMQTDFQQNMFIPFRQELELSKFGKGSGFEQYADLEVN